MIKKVNKKINIKIAAKILQALETLGYIFYIFYGGRGGGKTESIAAWIIYKMITADFKDMYFLALRDAKDTTETTLHPVFIKIIRDYGLDCIFKIQKETITCLHNGNTLIFKGTVNFENIKSIPRIYLIWMDEAANLSEQAFDAIAYTLRAHKDSRFILSFNPKVRNFIYRNFILNCDDISLVTKINYYDNKWFKDNEILERLRVGLKKSNYAKYRHVFLGELESEGNAKIFDIEKINLYNELTYEIKRTLNYLCITGDTAYKSGEQHDFTVFQLWGFRGNHGLYLIDQVRGKFEFPQLQNILLQKFQEWSNMFNGRPIHSFVENKASGISLVQQLRSKIPKLKEWQAKEFGLNGDKVERANSVNILIDDKKLYIPANKQYTKEYINELDLFGIDLKELKRDERKQLHDDQVDATVMAMSIYKKRYYKSYRGLDYVAH